jgi:hypothetical protein
VVATGESVTRDFKAVKESDGVIAIVLFVSHAEYLKYKFHSAPFTTRMLPKFAYRPIKGQSISERSTVPNPLVAK